MELFRIFRPSRAVFAAVVYLTACKSSPDPGASTTPAPAGPDAGAPDGGGSQGGTSVAPTYVTRDVNHILGTGQSLSLGATGAPPLTTSQPFSNLMFDTGLVPSDRAPSSFVPLVESSVFFGTPVETPSSSLANLVTELVPSHQALVSLHGVSGASYPMIAKGTEAYANGLAQVRAAKVLAEAAQKTYAVRAITVVHGESDGWKNWNDQYDRALLEWQVTYDEDIKAITGQSEDIPMLHSQYSAWTPVETTPTNIIPALQLRAHVAAPGRVVLVGPKYVLPYSPDGFHLTNEGYRWLGEYYAKAYVKQVLEGQRWEPVRPKEIRREGSVVTVTFFVPVPPLVIDTERVVDPGTFGFEVADDAGTTIQSVAVTSRDAVTLQLSQEPSGTDKRLRYAFSGVPGSLGGPSTGPRGNLRDSDATPSRTGHALFNWCVHFDEPMP